MSTSLFSTYPSLLLRLDLSVEAWRSKTVDADVTKDPDKKYRVWYRKEQCAWIIARFYWQRRILGCKSRYNSSRGSLASDFRIRDALNLVVSTGLDEHSISGNNVCL